MSPARLQEVLHARGVRALLLPPGWSGNTPDWGGFNWDDFYVVRFGYSLEAPAAHLVSSDQLSNGLPAFEHMWKNGYRRIGMVMWSKQGTRLVRFSAGYLYAQLQVDTKLRLPPLVMNEINPVEDERRFLAWLKKFQPDAIMTDLPLMPKMLAKADTVCRKK